MESDTIRRALEENEDWYRDLVDHSRDLLCIHDLQGRLLSINPTPARLLGYTVEEMLRIPMRELSPPEFRPQFDEYLEKIERTGAADGLMAVMTRAGERRIWEYHNTLRTEGVASPIVRGMAHDVTEQKQAVRLLREANQRLVDSAQEREKTIRELTLFRTLLDQCNDAICVLDPATLRFLDLNERSCKELGYSREELLSMTVFDIDPVYDKNDHSRFLEELRESRAKVFRSVHRRKDGTTFPVEIDLHIVWLEREYTVAIVRNITEQVRAERDLRQSEMRERQRATELGAVLDTVPVAVYIARDADCKYITTNRTGSEELGLPGGANVSKSAPSGERLGFRVLRDGIEVPAEELPMQRTAATGQPERGVPLSLVFADGTPRQVLFNAVPLLGDDGKPAGVVGASIDVTELKQAEDRLREYERVVEGLDEMILVVDQDYRYVLANQAFLRNRGLNREQVVGHSLAEMTGKGVFETVIKEKLDECFKGKVVQYEKRYEFPDLGERDVLVSYYPIAESGCIRVAVVMQDISERKHAEERLREFERVVEGVEEMIVVIDRDYRYVLANNAMLRYRGGSKEQVVGHFAWEAVGRETFDKVIKKQLDECFAGNVVHFELRIAYPDLGERDTSISYFPIQGPNGIDRAACILQDITERRQAEEALRLSEERFRVALKNSPITVFSQDRDLRYTWLYNPTIQRPENEFLGKTTSEFFGSEAGEQIAAVRRRVLETGVGERHEVMIPDSRGKHYFDTTLEPVRNQAGEVIGITGASMDITAIKQASEALREAKERLTEEKLYLEQSIDTELGFGEIIGHSEPLKSVMKYVSKVASSEATVLVLGETGTGKELVARAIHRMSTRQGNAFIKMNCAAIPSGLLESELFGHEKGAFTGAVGKKVGRLELADRGTLFLDEIGEVPLELQPKLLRVLQDHEFERLGGTQTLKVDFRLIAATNRDLLDDVRQNLFRSDLFYRLNVFPIHVPPLRERREDIPLLVEHFVRQYSSRMNKTITSIPKKTMEALTRWDWPGNIRELENFVERSVILSQGSVLHAPLGELDPVGPTRIPKEKETERDRFLRAMRESQGEIAGPGGAAAKLGMKRTTFLLKLKQLGIRPEDYRK